MFTYILFSFSQVALLSGADESTSELCFQYGRNLGLSFQLVDDLLDFVSSAQAMGKPTAADLKLGLATAPVLFACEKVLYFKYSFFLWGRPHMYLYATIIIGLEFTRYDRHVVQSILSF